MEHEGIREVEIVRVNMTEKAATRKKDYIAKEAPLHVFLNETHYVTILCSPNMLKEMAIGHLFSEGVLHSLDDIKEVSLENDGRCMIRLEGGVDVEKRISLAQPFARLIVTACGSAENWPLSKLIDRIKPVKIENRTVVKAEMILECVRRLGDLSTVFRKTGGVHVASLNTWDGKLVAFAEDVGRHNAVDKVIGAGVLAGVDFRALFLAVSGRLSGDIVLKAGRMRISLVASQAAALDSGIEVAERLGICLLGFVRGNRMNVYVGSDRVVL
ncbi:MAG: formate dehydrogenase accessory sulfurtransferase FdhD [Candidatus Bathyarchaeia archaeon]